MNARAEKLAERARELGFSKALSFPANLIKGEERIRERCTPKYCAATYGKNWVCPPGSGSLEECTKRRERYKNAILIQSLNEQVDTGDRELMNRLETEHNRRARLLYDEMSAEFGDVLLLSVGGCDLCEVCSYPEPCRLPEKRSGAFCSFGIDVGKLCESVGMEYAFESGTLRLMACILY